MTDTLQFEKPNSEDDADPCEVCGDCQCPECGPCREPHDCDSGERPE